MDWLKSCLEAPDAKLPECELFFSQFGKSLDKSPFLWDLCNQFVPSWEYYSDQLFILLYCIASNGSLTRVSNNTSRNVRFHGNDHEKK